jgi:hypothetical protein
MKRIVVLSHQYKSDNGLIVCLQRMFPECEIQVMRSQDTNQGQKDSSLKSRPGEPARV